MVALDDRRARAGLDDVRVDRSLCEEADLAELFRLVLKNESKLAPDDLALLLGIGHALELCKKAVGSVHAAEVERLVLEYGADLLRFALAHETVIDINARELAGHRAREQRRAHRGIHAAGETEQYLFTADLLADLADLRFKEALHRVIPGAAADIKEEVFENEIALHGVGHFRMELHAVEPALFVHIRRYGCEIGVTGNAEALGQRRDEIGVAHKHVRRHGAAGKERERGVKGNGEYAVLALRARLDRSAAEMADELHAVADAEHRDAELQHGLVAGRGIVAVYAVRSAGEDDALRRHRADLLHGHFARTDLGIDAVLAHAARDQLLVLPAEIQNQYSLSGHK